MKRAALLLALLAVPGAAAVRDGNWRAVATAADRERLRGWRDAWQTALAEARAGGGGATIAADPALFAPDGALAEGALPPPGEYRCRRVRVGARRGAGALAEEAWRACRIDGAGLPRRFAILDGAERPAGLIYDDRPQRSIFLGTAIFADEHRAPPYGHAAGRDVAGLVERIGERRWRLALPSPRFGAALDLIELVPA